MPRRCTSCDHPQVAQIDAALVTNREPVSTIATRYNLAPTSVDRHRRNHLPAKLVKAHDAAEVLSADKLLEKVETLMAQAQEILQSAKAKKNNGEAIRAIRESRECLKLYGRMIGMFAGEGAHVVDNRLQVAIFKDLSTDDLRKFIESTKALPS